MDFIKKKIDELMENQTHMLEAIRYLDERLKKIEDEIDKERKLDEIIVKKSDDILVMKKSKQENDVAIKKLDAKIDEINKELEMTRKELKDKEETTNKRPKSFDLLNQLKCKMCTKSFHRFADLENHIKSDHDKHQNFKCDLCGKCFVLNWRLSKHMRLHTEENVRHCYYFNNDKICPYEELGCKFLHAEANICHFGTKCKRTLCPHKHIADVLHTQTDTIEKIVSNENKELDDNSTIDFDSVVTSTPQKKHFQCEECINRLQCTYCYARQVVMTDHFSYDVQDKPSPRTFLG